MASQVGAAPVDGGVEKPTWLMLVAAPSAAAVRENGGKGIGEEEWII